MRDVNDLLPKLPDMKWGALFNWKLSDAEINDIVRRPPFPEDSKWHSVFKNPEFGNEVIVDGKIINQADDSKLS